MIEPGEVLSAFVDILDLKSFSVEQDGVYSVFRIEWLSGGVAELKYNRMTCLWNESSFARDMVIKFGPSGVMTYLKNDREVGN